MRIVASGPGAGLVILEPGDPVVITDGQGHVLAGPTPLPESRTVPWEVEVDGWVTWAVLDERGEILFENRDGALHVSRGDTFAVTESWEGE